MFMWRTERESHQRICPWHMSLSDLVSHPSEISILQAWLEQQEREHWLHWEQAAHPPVTGPYTQSWGIRCDCKTELLRKACLDSTVGQTTAQGTERGVGSSQPGQRDGCFRGSLVESPVGDQVRTVRTTPLPMRARGRSGHLLHPEAPKPDTTVHARKTFLSPISPSCLS